MNVSNKFYLVVESTKSNQLQKSKYKNPKAGS